MDTHEYIYKNTDMIFMNGDNVFVMQKKEADCCRLVFLTGLISRPHQFQYELVVPALSLAPFLDSSEKNPFFPKEKRYIKN